VLIANFVQNLFGKSRQQERNANEDLFRYSVPKDLYGPRKLSDARSLRTMHKQISRGEGRLAEYINRELLSKHHVQVPRRKLFAELGKVKRYFQDSGFSMPSTLSERGLYAITKNVFWNLHHFNMESKRALAAKAIHSLYGDRATLLETFAKSLGQS